jgi:hypothetical protein
VRELWTSPGTPCLSSLYIISFKSLPSPTTSIPTQLQHPSWFVWKERLRLIIIHWVDVRSWKVSRISTVRFPALISHNLAHRTALYLISYSFYLDLHVCVVGELKFLYSIPHCRQQTRRVTSSLQDVVIVLTIFCSWLIGRSSGLTFDGHVCWIFNI